MICQPGSVPWFVAFIQGQYWSLLVNGPQIKGEGGKVHHGAPQ